MYCAHHCGQPGSDFNGRTLLRPRPHSHGKIEELIAELSQNFTIAIVTHSMQQAARVSDRTAYFHLGKLIEVNETQKYLPTPITN